MDYTISKADGTTLATVTEGAVNTTYSVAFVGKNYAAYGSYINNNFMRLLENSAKTSAPASPVKGQLWYDSTNNLVKTYNGSAWLTVGPNAATPITVKDEGSNLTTALASIDFVGSGVTATNTNGAVTVTIPGGGGSALTVKDEGVSLNAAVTSIDFVGAGVTATNNIGAITVTIPGGSGSSSVLVADEGSTLTSAVTAINFVGAGVTAANTGSSVTVTVPGLSGNLDSLSDVVVSSPVSTQVLTYNGTNWVNDAVNLTTNASIIDLQKKMFLLEKFGSVTPTVVTPDFTLLTVGVGWNNVLSLDLLVPRNTYSNRLYTLLEDMTTTSVPSLQSFSNTSGFDINLIVKARIKTYADDQTKFRFLIDNVINTDVPYAGSNYQQQLDNTYTWNVTVTAGQTRTFEMQGWVGSGSNGRGGDAIGGAMTINFGGWA